MNKKCILLIAVAVMAVSSFLLAGCKQDAEAETVFQQEKEQRYFYEALVVPEAEYQAAVTEGVIENATTFDKRELLYWYFLGLATSHQDGRTIEYKSGQTKRDLRELSAIYVTPVEFDDIYKDLEQVGNIILPFPDPSGGVPVVLVYLAKMP